MNLSPTDDQEKRMISGLLYDGGDAVLILKRQYAKTICHQLNTQVTDVPSLLLEDPSKRTQALEMMKEALARRQKLFSKFFKKVGKEANIGYGFDCDYGCNIELGDRVYMNSGCVILDCAPVYIGDDCLLGPGVQIYTAGHPVDPNIRRNWGPEFAKPITIQKDCWIGGSAIILPGVTIGEGSVVGAGSVVTKDVPPFTIVAGNPAKEIRKIEG